jgi:hypothetical protein
VTTPRTEVYLSGEELAAAAGISRTRLARLVRLGLVEPDPRPRRADSRRGRSAGFG